MGTSSVFFRFSDESPVGVGTDESPVGVGTDESPVGVGTDESPVGVGTDESPVGVGTGAEDDIVMEMRTQTIKFDLVAIPF